ncbi:hypothetical protein CONPUDRAFT_134026 [Coniophora puteana RWD-64-598 SS2]|uniref:DH domain-containing protein n=1 Tax=Coniophora puteana (strain RWD-64-598) TaxID=741705 RepID=A0A5M3N5P0_CONPW|nr:uncharacterized protein CONPUDRAFT_134026 [Coniophora puteana RWD-64-598 SS2]EIW86628.1 hypothetical protein CONPUDRAFT_134026 [Coniophora puteana RWD-64-598 SS2]
MSPTASNAPSVSPPDKAEKQKKASPLADLVETEKTYVDCLTAVIRNVAGAWSRSNLPPPELDTMFRSIEAIYKANRGLAAKLKDIGSSPSSPKAIGDLLMKWIDDLDKPYSNYCAKYCSGFDDWEPVRSNPRLPGVLEAFTESSPPSSNVAQALGMPESACWTLDYIFLLPKARIQYYRKLYNRLLKSTTPGKSDHRLLTSAVEKLNVFLATLESRATIRVSFAQESVAVIETPPDNRQPTPTHTGDAENLLSPSSAPPSATSSARGSTSTNGERSSRETALTSVSRESTQTLSSPVTDLERRLSTEKTLDIFSMEPKQVKLQMAPPSLPYAREVRCTANVVVRFTPTATGVEVVHNHGHIYILSDLFLLCEKMTEKECSEREADMWLRYPPLSGKVLRVNEALGNDHAFQVHVMRKEVLLIETESVGKRNSILAEFRECISFARTMSAAASEPVPPLPSLKDLPPGPGSAALASTNPLSSSLPQEHQQSQDNREPIRQAVAQPLNYSRPRPTQAQHEAQPEFSPSPERNSRSSGHLTSSQPPSPEMHGINGQRTPSLTSPLPGPMYPPRKSSNAPSSPPSSFQQGQIVHPPARNVSMRSQGLVSPTLDGGSPGMAYGPNRVRSPPSELSRQPMPPMHYQVAQQHQPHYPQHQPSIHAQQGPGLHHQGSVRGPIPMSPMGPPRGPSMQPIHQPHPGYPPMHPQGFPLRGPPHGPSQGPQYGPPHGIPPPRPPSEPGVPPGPPGAAIHKSLSSRSLASQYERGPNAPLPPVPSLPNVSSQYILPSQMGSRPSSSDEPSIQDPSPPTSPAQETKPLGPVKSVISATMKCKIFHQQQHAQWRALGSAKLTLYRQEPTNIKQLVVEADSKDKQILISTIVLTGGVERVGKTGVAIELSDQKGMRTGIIYMIQLRNEKSAGGLYESLLVGSDRAVS